MLTANALSGAAAGFICGCGGIGRRVRFRFLWSQGCAGSSPVTRTKTKGETLVVSPFVLPVAAAIAPAPHSADGGMTKVKRTPKPRRTIFHRSTCAECKSGLSSFLLFFFHSFSFHLLRRDPRGLSFCFARGSRDCTCTSFRRRRKKRIKHRSIPLLLFCRGGVGTPPARKTLTFSSSYHKIQIADPGKRSAHQSGRARDRHSAKKRGHRHSGTAQKSTDPAKRSGAAGAQAL